MEKIGVFQEEIEVGVTQNDEVFLKGWSDRNERGIHRKRRIFRVEWYIIQAERIRNS